ncbi:MAG: alpha/beta hydrolase, partial [Alphaproteobacteria bacterium]|nr:alpha/beta hydrolase [Alphaproteobacteria bacterium]
RTLAYASWGSGERVLIHYHGTSSSRFEAAAVARVAEDLPLRIIGVDRPGCGGSSHDPKRDFRSFQADVENLADHLGIQRYAVSGVSGGAAFACQAALSPRTIKVYPLNAPPDLGSKAGPLLPFSLRFLIWLMIRPSIFRRTAPRAAADPLSRARRSDMPEIDSKVLLEEIPDIWTAAIKEGTRPGTDGVARDTVLLRQPWRLDWNNLQAPIEFHAGKLDPFLPFPRALVNVQSGVSLVEFEGGHIAALGLSALRSVVEDVLKTDDA